MFASSSGNEFFVKRAGYNTFDVFAGKQWSSWSRLRAGRSGVYVAMGEKVDHATTRALAASINPKLGEQLIVLQ